MGLEYNHEQVASLIATQQSRPGALLPILHDIQDALGFIPPGSVTQIASALNLSRAEVHGVITFYHHFRTTPPARHTIQICCAEACQSMGAEQLVKHAEQRLAGCKQELLLGIVRGRAELGPEREEVGGLARGEVESHSQQRESHGERG